jgi:hypothetical protein
MLSTAWVTKSHGLDLICPRIAKRAIDSLLPEITLLFNRYLEYGCYPRIFKEALVSFIPKPNSSAIQTHKAFRPICLLSVIGKGLDTCFVNRITWHSQSNNLLSPRQYGFVPQRSTVDAISDLLDTIRPRIAAHDWVAIVSFDVQSAFDNAKWHQILSPSSYSTVPPTLSSHPTLLLRTHRYL